MMRSGDTRHPDGGDQVETVMANVTCEELDTPIALGKGHWPSLALRNCSGSSYSMVRLVVCSASSRPDITDSGTSSTSGRTVPSMPWRCASWPPGRLGDGGDSRGQEPT